MRGHSGDHQSPEMAFCRVPHANASDFGRYSPLAHPPIPLDLRVTRVTTIKGHPLTTHRILAALTALWVTTAGAAPLVITGAPNGSWSQMRARYQPIARYLSAALHRPVTFRNPYDLVDFGQWVQRRRADVIFGGPQILSWAGKRYGYTPVLTGRGGLAFTLVARSRRIRAIADLRAGQAVCGLSPPNLGTMALLAHYPDPLRQPYIVMVSSPAAALKGVSTGRCLAAAVPTWLVTHLGPLHVVAPLGRFPNQGFAVSDRLSPNLQARIAHALVAAAHAEALGRLQVANRITGWRIPGPARYVGYGHLVAGVLGYATFHASPAP